MGPVGVLLYDRILPSLSSSIGRVRHELDDALCRVGLAQARRADVVLFASEAVTNVVLHAYVDTEPGPLYAAAELRRAALVLAVCDAGHGIRPRADSPGAGLGLAVMVQLCDELTIRRPPGQHGTQVCATFRTPAPASSAPATRRLPMRPGSDHADALAEYVRALLACSHELQADTQALIAHAEQAVRRGQQLRRSWLDAVA